MASKAFNIRMDETELLEMKRVAEIYNMTMTDLIKNAVKEYMLDLEQDPFYKLTRNISDASEEESREILEKIEALSDDDLTIVSSKKITV